MLPGKGVTKKQPPLPDSKEAEWSLQDLLFSALVLRKSALSLVLATLPLIFPLTPSGQPTVSHHFLTDSSFHSY